MLLLAFLAAISLSDVQNTSFRVSSSLSAHETALVEAKENVIVFWQNVTQCYIYLLTKNNSRFLVDIKSGIFEPLRHETFSIVTETGKMGQILLTPDGCGFILNSKGQITDPPFKFSQFYSSQSPFTPGRVVSLLRSEDQFSLPAWGTFNHTRSHYSITVPLEDGTNTSASFEDSTYFCSTDELIDPSIVYIRSYPNGTTVFTVNESYSFLLHLGSQAILVKSLGICFNHQQFHGGFMLSPFEITLHTFNGTPFAIPGRSIELQRPEPPPELPSPPLLSTKAFFIILSSSLIVLYFLLSVIRHFLSMNSIQPLYICRSNASKGRFNGEDVTVIKVADEEIVQSTAEVAQYRQRVSRVAHLVYIYKGEGWTFFVYNSVMVPLNFAQMDAIQFARSALAWLYKMFSANLVYTKLKPEMVWIHSREEFLGIDWAVVKSSDSCMRNSNLRDVKEIIEWASKKFEAPQSWRLEELIYDLESESDNPEERLRDLLRHFSFWEADHIMQLMAAASNHVQNKQNCPSWMRKMLDDEKMTIMGCENWFDVLPEPFQRVVGDQYYRTSVYELWRMLRNKYEHNDQVKFLARGMPITIQSYFVDVIRICYPPMIRYVYNFMKKYCKAEFEMFAHFYDVQQ